MVSAIRSSLGGLKSASRGVSVSAANIVNMRTSSRVETVSISPVAKAAAARSATEDGGIYEPKTLINVSVAESGIKSIVREKTPSHVVAFDPDDPNANNNGMVALPNVSLIEEMTNLDRSQKQFAANVAVLQAEDEMTGALLDRDI